MLGLLVNVCPSPIWEATVMEVLLDIVNNNMEVLLDIVNSNNTQQCFPG